MATRLCRLSSAFSLLAPSSWAFAFEKQMPSASDLFGPGIFILCVAMLLCIAWGMVGLRRATRALKRTNETLESRVAQRAAELTEASNEPAREVEAREERESVADDNHANRRVLSGLVRMQELEARLRVGERMVQLQDDLAQRLAALERALGEVDRLQSLLPICSYCKRIRDDRNYWQQVETYVSTRTGVQFSHGVCPDCYEGISAELEKAEF